MISAALRTLWVRKDVMITLLISHWSKNVLVLLQEHELCQSVMLYVVIVRYLTTVQRRHGLNCYAAGSCNFPTDSCRFPTEEIWVLKILILPLNFPPDDDDDDVRMNFNVLRLQGHVTHKNNSEVTW